MVHSSVRTSENCVSFFTAFTAAIRPGVESVSDDSTVPAHSYPAVSPSTYGNATDDSTNCTASMYASTVIAVLSSFVNAHVTFAVTAVAGAIASRTCKFCTPAASAPVVVNVPTSDGVEL